jgi:HEAT repeat protein
MDMVDRIVALLGDESPRKRIAAAVVLAELGVRTPAATAALSRMARSDDRALAEPALEALARLGAPRFPAVLQSLRNQPWEAVSKAALSVRQAARAASPGERKAMARQAAAFLAKVRGDESALRGVIKILGYLELPETAKRIAPFLSARHPPLVRVEAITALRFALGEEPAAAPLRALIGLLEERDALVARAARDTLTLVPGMTKAQLLALARKGGELSLWAVDRLRNVGAAKELSALAGGADRGRAEAAVRALSGLSGTGPMLAAALAGATEEGAAHALADALERVPLEPADLSRLRAAGSAMLKKSFAVARRQLEPVRNADPQAWAQLLRQAMKKATGARAEAICELLARSTLATAHDRFAHASLLLRRSPLDPHPRARQADPALSELEKLAASGFALAVALEGDAALSDEARYHAAFHFSEHAAPEVRAQGVALLEALAARGRGKLARAARNKLSLLRA